MRFPPVFFYLRLLLALLFVIPIPAVADRMVDPLARALKFSIKSLLLHVVADRMVDSLARADSRMDKSG